MILQLLCLSITITRFLILKLIVVRILPINIVSKGYQLYRGSLQSATRNMPSEKALMFNHMLKTGVFFVFIAFFMFLPVTVLMPQKHAICFHLNVDLSLDYYSLWPTKSIRLQKAYFYLVHIIISAQPRFFLYFSNSLSISNLIIYF